MISKPETRLVYSSRSTSPRVAVREWGATAFLFARNHPILHCSIDRRMQPVWFFGTDAGDDLALYTKIKDHMMALRDRALEAAHAADNAPGR
jgi:hypothetical protein